MICAQIISESTEWRYLARARPRRRTRPPDTAFTSLSLITQRIASQSLKPQPGTYSECPDRCHNNKVTFIAGLHVIIYLRLLMDTIQIEICCGSAGDVIEAEKGGADRVELNSNLFQGRLTPTILKLKTLGLIGLKPLQKT